MADSSIVVVGGEAAEAVKPLGRVELLKWFVKQARAGHTLDQAHKEYPGDITKGSLSVKLSNLRKWAESKGIKDIPQLKRAGGGRAAEDVNAEALAAELNLRYLVEDETETEDETAE